MKGKRQTGGVLACVATGLALSLSACVTSGFTAAQSVNPVLLGPVTSIGAAAAPGAPGTPSQPFASKNASHVEYYVAVDSSGRGKRRSTTTAGDVSASSTSPQQGDLDVLVATSGDLAPRIGLHRLHCSGTELNVFYLYMVVDSWCETAGDVYRPSVAAIPPPPGPGALPPDAPPAPPAQ
jgi:hypothetical protein